MNELKIGDILIAIDECIMDDTNEPALTIGKEYIIDDVYKDMFCIVNDRGHNHYFEMNDNEDYWENFFKLKE